MSSSSPQASPRGVRFWLAFASVCVSCSLGALILASVSTALPSIVHDLDSTDFTWVGSAYVLAGTAFLPWIGTLAELFGRREAMLGCLFLFGGGSAMCAAAKNMALLIAGRTIEGIGGGGLLALTEIIIADLVPLRERGVYMGIIGGVWAMASAVGPVAGGGFANSKWTWRALFYLMIPLSGIAFVLALLFLRLKRPQTTFGCKLRRMDWTGNILFIASTTSAAIALAWAGVEKPWNSVATLVPLILGLTGMVASVLLERYWVTEPTIPWNILSNRTSCAGYIATFFHSFIGTAINYYIPVYFQAVKEASSIQSSIDFFPLSFTMPICATIAGATVAKYNRYVPQNYLAWVLIIVGMGLLSLLHADSPARNWIGFQLVSGFGLGILYTCTTYPILAPIPTSSAAPALAFYVFIRSFAQTWGITIGSTILQNGLRRRLPLSFSEKFPEGVNIAYSLIPVIPTLDPALQDEVRRAFADSLSVLWQIMAGVGALGLLCTLLMKEVPMHTTTDENWGIVELPSSDDLEAKSPTGSDGHVPEYKLRRLESTVVFVQRSRKSVERDRRVSEAVLVP